MPHEHEGPVEWTGRNKTAVRTIHGTIVGTAVIYMAFSFGGHLMEDGNLTMIEAAFIGGLAICGFLASMPWIFMPAMHWGIEAWQARKGR